MFPTYSKLQGNIVALRSAFERTIRVLFIVAVPLSVGIYLVTPAFVRVGLGSSWVPAIVPMQVMALAGFFRAVSASGGAVFQGISRPDLDFKMNLIRSVAIVVTIWPLSQKFGITGAAISITIGIGLTIPFWLYHTRRLTGMSIKRYIESAGIPLLSAGMMFPIVQQISSPSIINLSAAIVAGVAIYTIACLGLLRVRGKDPIEYLYKE
jgi:O-antigen/teichoic acid export membrane protein